MKYHRYNHGRQGVTKYCFDNLRIRNEPNTSNTPESTEVGVVMTS